MTEEARLFQPDIYDGVVINGPYDRETWARPGPIWHVYEEPPLPPRRPKDFARMAVIEVTRKVLTYRWHGRESVAFDYGRGRLDLPARHVTVPHWCLDGTPEAERMKLLEKFGLIRDWDWDKKTPPKKVAKTEPDMPDNPAPDHIIDRAVELWKRMLRNPTFQHTRPGEGTRNEEMTQLLAASIAKTGDEESLERFGVELRKILTTPQRGYCPRSIGSDYGPDTYLFEAATRAGFTGTFPWKTDMYVNDDCVSVSVGYAAPAVHHYSLGDGRWLMVRLSGFDIQRVIDLVKRDPTGWPVEDAPVAAEAGSAGGI